MKQTADDQGKMPFLEHLAELRARLIKAFLGVLAGCPVCWNFSGTIMGLLLRPVLKVLPEGQGLIYTGLQDGFVIALKTSLWAGFFLSSPFWVYQLWAFAAPAMKQQEKKIIPALTALAVALMAVGAAFAYFLAFPLTFNFFLTFSTDHLHPLLAVDRYFSLALAFAMAFQLPLVLMVLGRMGLVSPQNLRRHRRYAILAAFVVGAVLTPPDVISQVLLASSLLALYELSILLIGRTDYATENRPEN